MTESVQMTDIKKEVESTEHNNIKNEPSDKEDVEVPLGEGDDEAFGFDDDDDDDEDDVQIKIGDIRPNLPHQALQKGISATISTGANAQQPSTPAGKLDVDQTATIEGKPIYDFDIAQMEDKPWRRPGADITDYFNYGFTEASWNKYCERQRKLRAEFSAGEATERIMSTIKFPAPIQRAQASNLDQKGNLRSRDIPMHNQNIVKVTRIALSGQIEQREVNPSTLTQNMTQRQQMAAPASPVKQDINSEATNGPVKSTVPDYSQPPPTNYTTLPPPMMNLNVPPPGFTVPPPGMPGATIGVGPTSYYPVQGMQTGYVPPQPTQYRPPGTFTMTSRDDEAASYSDTSDIDESSGYSRPPPTNYARQQQQQYQQQKQEYDQKPYYQSSRPREREERDRRRDDSRDHDRSRRSRRRDSRSPDRDDRRSKRRRD